MVELDDVGVSLPWMRAEVISAVDAFPDPEYQQRVWVEGAMPNPTYFDDLDTNVHTLYDTPGVLPEPGTAVGTVLLDTGEARALADLDLAFGPLLRELGDASAVTYLSHPGWPDVVAAARRAAAVLHDHGGAFPVGTG